MNGMNDGHWKENVQVDSFDEWLDLTFSLSKNGNDLRQEGGRKESRRNSTEMILQTVKYQIAKYKIVEYVLMNIKYRRSKAIQLFTFYILQFTVKFYMMVIL